MVKTLLVLMFLVGVNVYADLVDDGFKAYKSGDKQKTKKLWSKACDGGIMNGCYNLGLLYSNGDGVRQDKQKAAKLYSKACDGGNMNACTNLGKAYYNGIGVRQNKQKAKELFGKACDGGHQGGCKGYRILNEQGI